MIRILQSVSNMDRGGIETMLMNYYRHLDRDQFQFDFLVNKEKPGFFDDEVRSLGGRIFMGPGLSPLKYPEYLRYMKTLLDREKEIKVLHAHNEAMEFYALNGAKKTGFPVRIAHAHNTHLPRGLKLPVKLVCKAMIPGAATDYFACGREAGIYYFGEKRWNESGVVIHNAIDLERFGYRSEVRTRLRREYHLEDKLVVGSVARFMVQKNHTRMLEQFACLKKIYPNSHLLLAGEGELQAAMEEKAKRLGIYDSVSFLGVQKDTSIWYQAMDVFLMPSLFEGLPVVGIEAQASGLPCVFSDTITDEIILAIAPLSFGVYLLHDSDFTRAFLWEKIALSRFGSLPASLGYLAIVTLCITCAGYLVDTLYQKIYRLVFRKKVERKVDEITARIYRSIKKGE